MKILYYDTSKRYCNYYYDIVRYLSKISVLTYVNRNIHNAINKYNPDVIILGFTLTDICNSKPNFFVKTSIPVYLILNKEYAGLKHKLEWIKKLKPKKVFTVHHDFKKYESICNIPFCKIMWSADETIFKKYDKIYKYDLFFSGVIREEQQANIRGRIYKKLDLIKDYKLLVKVGFFNNNKLKGSLNTFNLNDYANNLNHTKIALTTTGPADLVGTRYFEIMATNKALILCNRMPKDVYGDIVINNFNCIMFDDENDFIEKFKYYIEHEEERMKIVNQAYKYFLEKHTWDHKVNYLIENL